MKDDYLWDRSGEPDPEVERLEQLLGRLRHDRPAPEFEMPVRAFPHRQRWKLWVPLAAAAVLALVVTGTLLRNRPPVPTLEVARLAGAPRVGSHAISATGRIAAGQWLETDRSSRARIEIGLVGQVEIDPDTRVRLVTTQATEHRLALDRGTIHARIWAPPRLFFVETPSALAVDLGCVYTLQVDAAGAALLRVTRGWVSFEREGRESFVPEGALCATRPGIGPGTPYFEDAPEKLRAALHQFDFDSGGPAGGVPGGINGGVSGGVQGGVPGGVAGGIAGGVPGGVEGAKKVRAAALETVLAEARPRDAFTLWHLLARTRGDERSRVYDRMARLVPPPEGVTREGVLRGDRRMFDLWWDSFGLRSASFWRMWQSLWPPQTR